MIAFVNFTFPFLISVRCKDLFTMPPIDTMQMFHMKNSGNKKQGLGGLCRQRGELSYR